jgi:hypothetical protein
MRVKISWCSYEEISIKVPGGNDYRDERIEFID